MKKVVFMCALFCFAHTGVVTTAFAAQATSNRPIRLIVPYTPGGGADTVSRMLGPYISAEFGEQVLVDNRPGGNSIIGTEIVARATPDGHTIEMVDSAFMSNPGLYSKLPYDTLKDFSPVALVAFAPLILCVHPNVPANSVKELIALAKAQPRKLTFGSGGNGTASHIAGQQLSTAAGIELVHVPYKGAAGMATDLLGGHITMAFLTISVAKGQIASRQLRPLAITSAKRTPLLPEVITFTELGYPSIDFQNTNAIIAPVGTPRDFVKRLNTVVVRALKSPQVQEKFAELGYDSGGGTPEDFSKWLRAEVTKLAKLVKDSGAKVE